SCRRCSVLSRRRHVDCAGAAYTLLLVRSAWLREEVATETDAHVEQVLSAAAHHDHVGLEPRIRLEELGLDVAFSQTEPALCAREGRWNVDALIEVARETEILRRLETRAGAVGAVFVDDQSLARHDIADVVDHRLRHPGALPHPAILGPPLDVLR